MFFVAQQSLAVTVALVELGIAQFLVKVDAALVKIKNVKPDATAG